MFHAGARILGCGFWEQKLLISSVVTHLMYHQQQLKTKPSLSRFRNWPCASSNVSLPFYAALSACGKPHLYAVALGYIHMCAGSLFNMQHASPILQGTCLDVLLMVQKQSFRHTHKGHVHRAGHPSLADGRPNLVAQLHPSLNPGLDPAAVSLGSNVFATWLCTSCACGAPHIWTTKIYQRALSGTGCPVCIGSPPCRCSSLAARRPDVAAQWHPTLNGSLQPTDVAVRSHAKVHWQCHNHSLPGEWTAKVDSRTKPRFGNGRPACAQASRTRQPRAILAEEDHELAQQWHPTLNGSLSPEMITAGSGRRVAWLCPKSSCQHPHVWTTRLYTRRQNKCPFCSGSRVCHCNSLAARFPAIAAQWHPDLNRTSKVSTPEQCPPSSNRIVWWQHWSADGALHEWQVSINHRTAKGTGCPRCAGCRYKYPSSAGIHLVVGARISTEMIPKPGQAIVSGCRRNLG